ncbi:hypothetical protein ACJMK2_044150 [Sinanodonta woodiana]|uniref:Uncharacterized protein n=1 Tax=Sinanodonta woodiana TaxID=1069815 RepID=A0ABD3VZ38_SINWO
MITGRASSLPSFNPAQIGFGRNKQQILSLVSDIVMSGNISNSLKMIDQVIIGGCLSSLKVGHRCGCAAPSHYPRIGQYV